MEAERMKSYIIGVDGGGTKTDCALFDLDGQLIDSLKWGATSHEFLDGSYEACEREIGRMLDTLFQKNGIAPDQIRAGVFGMAGVDTAWQQKKVSEIVQKNGLSDCIVCNDGYLGIKAGTSRGIGVNVINGTGCSFEGINAAGEMLQIGGQSVILDDVAGGYVTGRSIISLAHREFFLGGGKTVLTKLLMNEIGAHGRDELMDELVRRVGEKTIEIKHLAHLMYEAAAMGDTVAVRFLKETGEKMAEYCLAVIENLRLHEEDMIEIVLIGSGFLKAAADMHIAAMQDMIAIQYPNVRFIPLRMRPVCGAVFWAFAQCGLLNGYFKQKLMDQLEVRG